MILLVEDDPITQFVHTDYLTKMGYVVECATTGAQALQMFEDHNYMLVLLDIGLPDIKGTEVCKRMRTHKEKGFIPVIALTAGKDKKIIMACLTAGAREVISKPLTFDQLKNLLTKHIQLSGIL
jgi:DNA-binding response OmpR family regulator